jgi:hypothetical protein
MFDEIERIMSSLNQDENKNLSPRKISTDINLLKIRSGSSPAIICIDGFLTKDDNTAKEWLLGLPARYARRAVYVLKWDSKNLSDFSKILDSASLFQKAVKQGSYLTGALGIASVTLKAREPWVKARNNTVQTGLWLADYIKQDSGKFVLMGHSLGARIVYYCLNALRTADQVHVIRDAYLFGGAIDNKACGEAKVDINWHGFEEVVSGKIHNYYSDEDNILKYLFKMAEGFTEEPVGRNPIESTHVKNYNVSDQVKGHTEYKGELSVILG